MKYTEEFLVSVIYKMMNAFALHRIILDDSGKPCDYEYIDVNPAFETFTGMLKQKVLGKRIHEILPKIGQDQIDWVDVYGKVALTGEALTMDGYSETLGKWYTIHVYSPEPEYFITIFNDITSLKMHEVVLIEQKNQLTKTVNRLQQSESELREKNDEIGALYEELTASEEELRAQFDALNEKEEALKSLAYCDQLTGLENRTAFLERLDEFLMPSEKSKKKAALIFMDMDNFKIVNDTMGHICGDQVLKEISNRLKFHLDDCDHIARMAGDEFAIALCNIKDEKTTYNKAKKIKAELDKPIIINDSMFHITTSMGIALCPQDGTTVQELLMNADTAMYKGKINSKNDISFYVPSMKAEMLRRSNMEKLLLKAILNKEFKLYFQPQYTIENQKLRGFEALIRWDSAETGMVNPMYFIPVAEETGLITQIGEWVLQEAGRLSQEWRSRFGCQGIMSVNVSPVQLRNVHFVDMVKQVVQSFGMEKCLELEITESIFIGQLQPVIEVLQSLRDWGIKISLDDFGTGYSSLNYLKNLPLSTLKIDRAFVANLGAGNVENNIAESIISMAHKIGLETIAEGVEKTEQLKFLENMGCNVVQGFLTGRPVPEEEVPKIIQERILG